MAKRLEELKSIVTNPDFFRNSSKSSETNYWVFDYDAKDELIVRAGIRDIRSSMEGFLPIQVFDIYEILIGYLEERKYIDKIIRMEEKRGIPGITGPISRTLLMASGTGHEPNRIVSYLKEHASPDSTIFFTGIGKCYPLLKGREVFSQVFYNLPPTFSHTPLILFYPGMYTEQELRIFGEVKEDNYYRARRIVI